MDYTIIRYKTYISDADHIVINENGFRCSVPAPSGKYKIVELPCKECCNITLHFVIETKKGNRLFNYGTAFLSLYCMECEYESESSDLSWAGLEKVDLYKTCLDYINALDNETRKRWVSNLSQKYELPNYNKEER